METYLLMLYVTFEQETAIKNLFITCGWSFDKTDTKQDVNATPPIDYKKEEIEILKPPDPYEKYDKADAVVDEEHSDIDDIDVDYNQNDNDDDEKNVEEGRLVLTGIHFDSAQNGSSNGGDIEDSYVKGFKQTGPTSSAEESSNEDTDQKGESITQTKQCRTLKVSKQIKGKQKQGKMKKEIYCDDCKTMFTSEKRFKGHKEKNNGQCVFKCEYCDKIYLYRKSKFDLHVRSAHTKERPFVCDICNKGYVTADKLKIHKRSHTGEKTCICEHCGKGFYSRGELAIHINYHHISKEERDEFHCDECNVTFCSKRYLNYHKTVTHSSQRDFFCNVCGKGFKSNSALQRHLKYIHTESRQFACTNCDKTFKSPSCLRKHMVRHRGDKNCVCMQCGKGFYEKTKLEEHMRIHTGEKPYSCDLCDFRCNLHGNLVKHRRKHCA